MNMHLPKWMRHSVRTLRKDMVGLKDNDILGGFKGLARELDEFFQSAKEYTDTGLHVSDTGTGKSTAEYTFDSKSGHWSPQKKSKETSNIYDVVVPPTSCISGVKDEIQISECSTK